MNYESSHATALLLPVAAHQRETLGSVDSFVGQDVLSSQISLPLGSGLCLQSLRIIKAEQNFSVSLAQQAL
jgi:hypothetical protein